MFQDRLIQWLDLNMSQSGKSNICNAHNVMLISIYCDYRHEVKVIVCQLRSQRGQYWKCIIMLSWSGNAVYLCSDMYFVFPLGTIIGMEERGLFMIDVLYHHFRWYTYHTHHNTVLSKSDHLLPLLWGTTVQFLYVWMNYSKRHCFFRIFQLCRMYCIMLGLTI